MSNVHLRQARPEDAAALLDIYRPFVTETTVSFEVDPPSVADFEARIRKALGTHTWLVAEREGRILGYAYGTVHRERAAYRWSAETSVYIEPRHQGQGLGRQLYARLFDDLAALGYCNAYAGITMPNPGSVALHQKVGFAPIGVFPRVGFKFGAWHDVSWWHRPLRAPQELPPNRAGLREA